MTSALHSLNMKCKLLCLCILMTSCVYYGSTLPASATSTTSSSCSFPAFVQTYGDQDQGQGQLERDWATRVRDQYTNFEQRVNITSGSYIVYTGDLVTAVRTCIQELPASKYIVAYSDEDVTRPSRRYGCLQFVRRSNSVLQIKQTVSKAGISGLSDSIDPALCEDTRLVLDDWLLVDRRHVLSEQGLCSLEGGFSIRIYDRLRNSGICDAYKGETRLESECTKGDGLHFNFRLGNCVPPDLRMYSTQRTFCLANWQDGSNSFTLLRHDEQPYAWLLRYPTVHGSDGFTAYLYFDLVADLTLSQTTQYLRLDVARDPAQLATSLCVDDYEACSYAGSSCATGRTALTCPRTCNVCNASRPIACSFDRDLVGHWWTPANSSQSNVSLSEGGPVLIVNAAEIIITRQVWETYHCVQWQPHPAIVRGNTLSYLVVKDNVNGCRPRYACLRVIKSSSSSNLVFVQISKTATWPLTARQDFPIDCSAFDDGDFINDVTLYPNVLQTSTYNLLVAGNQSQTLKPVECSWPSGVPQNVSMLLSLSSSSSFCPAAIRQRAAELILIPSSTCESTARRKFTCIDSGPLLPHSDGVIVTRLSSNGKSGFGNSTASTSLFCWIFPSKNLPQGQQQSDGAFYLVEGSNCNDAVGRKDFLPIATFKPLNTLTTTTTSTPLPSRRPERTTVLPSMDFSTKTHHNGGSNINRTVAGNGTDPDDVTATSESSYYSLVIASIILCVMEIFAFLPCF